jgi:hypothetical protein
LETKLAEDWKNVKAREAADAEAKAQLHLEEARNSKLAEKEMKAQPWYKLREQFRDEQRARKIRGFCLCCVFFCFFFVKVLLLESRCSLISRVLAGTASFSPTSLEIIRSIR